MKDGFDVFLSYNSGDRAVVERLAERLVRVGVSPWFDVWALPPGADWQTEIADGMGRASSCAVFIGPTDVGGWEHMEMQLALDRHVSDPNFRVFLVLLPGLPDRFEASRLPPFLRMRTWVDFRAGLDSDRSFTALVSAVNGLPLGPAVPLEPQMDVCPYRGLDVFDEQDAEFFFGRDRDVQRLREKLKATRFLAVLGASGSGKSSLVRAGLMPELRTDGCELVILRPGTRPLESLAAHLLRAGGRGAMRDTVDELRDDERTLHFASSLLLADRPSTEQLVVVVDQFEEVFSLCRDEDERRAFFANLLYAASVPDGAARVIVTMRADFYHRCGAYPALAQTLAAQQYLVSPIDRDGLRQTIEEPARLVGLALEPGLAQTILDDVAGQPGVLPLLEHTMLELWRRRVGGTMTLGGYQDAGGVQGAIAKRADDIFASFTPSQQELARWLFLRLTQPGEGTEDTRRRAPVAELAANEGQELGALLRALVDARLLTTSHDDVLQGDVVEVAHEALIRNWPHLRAWIEDDRAGLRLHRRLTEAAYEWKRLDGDPGALLRGGRLAQAIEWRSGHEQELTPDERQFLDASIAAENVELAAARRRARRLRRLAVALGIVGIAAATAAAYALQQRSTATKQKNAVRLASLAAAANTENAHLGLTLLLALAASKGGQSAQADASMTTALLRARQIGVSAILHDDTAVANAVAWSRRGVLATASANGTVRLWDMHAMLRGSRLDSDGVAFTAVAFDPTSRTVAAGGRGGVFVWREPSGKPLRLPIPDGAVTSLAYRPDSTVLVAGTSTGAVWKWSTTSGPRVRVYESSSPIMSVAVDTDGAVAIADGSDTAVVVRPGRASIARLRTSSGGVRAVAFSPTAHVLGTGSGNRVENEDKGWIQLWDERSLRSKSARLGSDPTPDAFTNFVDSIAFSGDGSQIAGAGPDGTVRVWDVATGDRLESLAGDAGHLHSVAFDPNDGHTLAAAANDGEVVVWREGKLAFGTPTPQTASLVPDASARGENPAFSEDREWVTAESADGWARIWATSPRKLAGRIRVGTASALAIDNSGDTLAVGYASGAVQLWDVKSSARIGAALRGDTDAVHAVAFSPDGATLASGGSDAATYLWDVRSRDRLGALRLGGGVMSLAFSPNGRMLATGQEDGVRLWDVRSHLLLADAFGDIVPTELGFSADGRLLAGRNANGRRLWSGILWSDDRDRQRQVCALVHGGITLDEWREVAPTISYRPTCP
jgi:WD40 repeat protein